MINAIHITGVHKKLTADVENYTRLKIGVLEKFIPKNARESAQADVKIKQSKAKNKEEYECEVILKLPKKKITIHKKGWTIPETIDLVEDSLKIQLKKYKEKHAGPRLHRRLIGRLKRR